jgi:hypothetical protein
MDSRSASPIPDARLVALEGRAGPCTPHFPLQSSSAGAGRDAGGSQATGRCGAAQQEGGEWRLHMFGGMASCRGTLYLS